MLAGSPACDAQQEWRNLPEYWRDSQGAVFEVRLSSKYHGPKPSFREPEKAGCQDFTGTFYATHPRRAGMISLARTAYEHWVTLFDVAEAEMTGRATLR